MSPWLRIICAAIPVPGSLWLDFHLDADITRSPLDRDRFRKEQRFNPPHSVLMTTKTSKLENGLTIASHEMANLHTVSIGVWVASGSRHERPHEHGVSHLLEHMAFKGTARRSARDIVVEIEQVGGDMNAATSLELTAYYVRVLEGDHPIAIDVLADILTSSTLDAEELEREKDVVLQEIAGIQDVPEEIAYDLISDAAFPNQSVGRPVIGTPESVSQFKQSDLKGLLDRQYVPSSMVVAAAGAINHDDFVRHVGDKFGALDPRTGDAPEKASFVGGASWSDHRFGQAHLLLGFDSPSYRDPTFYPCQVFSGLLGGGMSSRLFQEAREKRGLCYSIYASAWSLSDGGMFNIHAATGEEQVEELRQVIVDELRHCADKAPGALEVERAKAQLKAGLLMSLESSSARAEQMARQLLAFGRTIDAEELTEKVEAVTAEDIRLFAERLITSGKPAVAVVGCGQSSRKIAEDSMQCVIA